MEEEDFLVDLILLLGMGWDTRETRSQPEDGKQEREGRERR